MFCWYDLVSCDWVCLRLALIWIDLWQARRWGRTGEEQLMGSETMCLYECQSRKLGRPFQDQHCFSPQACHVPKDIFIRQHPDKEGRKHKEISKCTLHLPESH